MLNVKKYFGPPGTGKTTKLLGLVEKHLEEGVQPDQMAFISFSVKVKLSKPKSLTSHIFIIILD